MLLKMDEHYVIEFATRKSKLVVDALVFLNSCAFFYFLVYAVIYRLRLNL